MPFAAAPPGACRLGRSVAATAAGLWSWSLASGFLASGCARRETPVQAGIRDQVLYLGNGSEPRDLDPHIVVSYNDFNIVLALFEGLTGDR